jgi:hypothetical protein
MPIFWAYKNLLLTSCLRNVQVTLGILAALTEKSQTDAALIAPTVLKILEMILRSDDITMIESSLPTWQAFCENHDPSSLFADQAYRQQYETVVRSYAQLASSRHVPGKGNVSRPVQARWRSAGLEAIKSIASSDALASVAGRQINTIMPRILENLWTDDEDVLDIFVQRVQMEEKVDTEKLLRRRASTATVQTEKTGDANPVAITGTAGDVDKLAEEDIGVLAMQCLKSIFVVSNQSQLYGATDALLGYISERVKQGHHVVQVGESRKQDRGWAIKIYSITAHWAPVQDRYAILVSAMNSLLRMPMKEELLNQHLAYTAMIGSLLRSDVNLIGLSVMDVLLGLIREMKKLFSLAGDPHRSGSIEEMEDANDQDTRSAKTDLLSRLEKCVGDLAAHVYYADQVADMISAIIIRLRPNRSASSTSTPQGERNEGAENGAGASSADLTESQSQLEAYFSYHQGRVSALKAIRAILLVANPKSKLAGTIDLSRNRVPIQVWEGTHWLLRDSDGRVRKAYIEALVTWLDRETTAADAKARDEALLQPRSSMKSSREPTDISQRAVSNTGPRERPQGRGRRSQFLPMLHLTIYDNALQFVDSEPDIALLHILLTKLAMKLGVNATRYGIPMIYRLQEDVQEIDQPLHKVRVAALCHGYFWALAERFDFDTTAVGRAIHNEIARRKSKGFWVDGINVPPPQVSAIKTPGTNQPQPMWDANALEGEEILPFDDRTTLVECIGHSYEESARSPPASPAVSPGRRLSNPMGSSFTAKPAIHASHIDTELPSGFREEMLTDWSREAALTALTSVAKSESVTGSRTGATGQGRGMLTINTGDTNGNGYRNYIVSPFGSLRPGSAQQLDRVSKLRKSSVRSGLSPSVAASAKAGVASVEQLKMILSGDASPEGAGIVPLDDDSGDSMMSYDYTASELSFNPPVQTEPTTATSPDTPKRSISVSSRQGPLSSNPPHEATPTLHHDEAEEDDDVPPVPPLPQSFSTSMRSDISAGDVAVQDHAFKGGPRRATSSRGGESATPSTRFLSVRSRADDGGKGGMDLQELLRGIDSRPSEGSLSNVTRPPY